MGWGKLTTNSYDGQAGAAGITLERRTPETEAAAIENLWTFLRSQGVPTYAIPRLVRVTKEYVPHALLQALLAPHTDKLCRVATGVTFKQAKGDLAKRSWDPVADSSGDALYWLNSGKDGKSKKPVYERLERDSWDEIESGRAKL